MDISTLSKQLNMSAQQLRQKMSAAGFHVPPRANKIDNQLAKRVLQSLGGKIDAAQTSKENKDVSLPKVLTVKELAAILKLDVATVIKKLIQSGVMATINEEIDYDTAAIIAGDLGFNVSEVPEATSRLGIGHVAEVMEQEKSTNADDFIVRPPLVAVMGHVDHGKTTLLDSIRKTKVVETEAGRITQHIGAYQVKRKDKAITFLDTPGHEAFSAMRARGANVTDIIVLTVAADDGVKPQTVEVINRAKLTHTPIIVAINKIDKPDANVERVKKELADFGVLIEEWGGSVPVAKISGMTGQGVDELLDLILLQAEVMDLKANPKGQVLGTVIESHLSKTLGSVATLVVQNGTLNLGDILAVGRASGKIRSMTDDSGKKLKSAGPSAAVQITGLSDVPSAGDILKTYSDVDSAKTAALNIARSERAKRIMTQSPVTLAGGKDLNLIIKVDVAGSLEAITGALDKLKNDEVKINVITQDVGEINENDILRGESAKALVIGFHTRINSQAAKLAQTKKIPVQLYDIIYELVEDITQQVVSMMTPEVVRADIGRAKILAVFRNEKEKQIVGGTVIEGKIKETAGIEIKRADDIIGSAEIIELQQNKMKTKEVLNGFEFGINLKTNTKIQEGDLLVVFEETVKKKTI
ncbi:MAG: translation initiation factor IF-2 [Candidatus Doudnabacteria bacterium]|nr:translation initiation factor IF-2 [Candidatus Doudnabacteria bacterium]